MPSSKQQQIAVRELFECVAFKPPSWRFTNPLSKWRGITLSSRRKKGGNVIKIEARIPETGPEPEGPLDDNTMGRLGELLPHLQVLDLRGHMLHGHCNLHNLPPQLEVLDLSRASTAGRSRLTGTLNVRTLPTTLRVLSLWGNSFTTPSPVFDWAQLAARCKHLEKLWLGQNSFTGPIFKKSAEDLPPLLRELSIEDNRFSGTLDRRNMPLHMSLLVDKSVTAGGNQRLKISGTLPKSAKALFSSSSHPSLFSPPLGSVSSDGAPASLTAASWKNNKAAHDDELLKKLLASKAAAEQAETERKEKEKSEKRARWLKQRRLCRLRYLKRWRKMNKEMVSAKQKRRRRLIHLRLLRMRRKLDKKQDKRT